MLGVVALEARRLGAVSINVRITAVRKLAIEATNNGLLAPELAAGITRVNGTKSKGVRIGNWLSPRLARALPLYSSASVSISSLVPLVSNRQVVEDSRFARTKWRFEAL